ncbi:hypothetical protein [Roseobacter sinensis]|uniref:Uncharacterized protein n=1 Tax=Roseobacter sinensis TaxID=2931391 RepID=A0ABT3BAW1_9RHOB|nr:hypothetical protein [Roseobacter sp. WL0113]MCV3270718.1 hypothetical protein [Roseobacter sp. WL0113]
MALCPGLCGAAELDRAIVYLKEADGTRIETATLAGPAESYLVVLNDAVFSDHFLSMWPFRCIESAEKTWCHVPYPYDVQGGISEDLTDLEYDFLFVWNGKANYGIDMWNGVFSRLEAGGAGLVGRMQEMNMNLLAVPPTAGELRPIREVDLAEADPDSHWLPRMVIR